MSFVPVVVQVGELAALGALGAGCAWSLLGWTAEDRAYVRAAAKRCLRLLDEAYGRVLRILAARMPGAMRARDPPPSAGEISEMVDAVALGLSAGLSFDAALGLYCEYRTGRMANRLAAARLLWQMGSGSREDELLRAARDLSAPQLEGFASVVGGALAMGAPLADTLAAQSAEMRAAHRADVERQIERATVKLLVPTGTLILPALLLSIMGPLLAASGMV